MSRICCVVLLLASAVSTASAQSISVLVVDPWPEVIASGGNASGFIPDPMASVDGAIYPQRAPHQGAPIKYGPIPWFRPGERVYRAPQDRPDDLLRAIAASDELRRWLWTTTAPTVRRDPRYQRLLDMWRAGPTSAVAYAEKLRQERPKWAQNWQPWRMEGWLPWAGGDAPCHYDAPMWWLQAAQTGDPEAAQAYREHLAHVLSVGFNWQIGEMRYEKGGAYTGDFYRDGRVPWSHQWVTGILAAAHFTGLDPEEPATQAAHLIAQNILARPPRVQAKWGIRIIAHYLRALRAFHVFAPEILETEDLARGLIDDILRKTERVNGEPAYWRNDGPSSPQPHTVDCWQDWLMLCEIGEWAVIWGDRALLHQIEPIARWHLENTTQTSDPRVIHVGYSLPLPGPWPQEARATTPYHTTYAVPILFGLSKIVGEPYTSYHKRAWEGVMQELDRVDYHYGSPTLGPAGPKQNNRVMNGMRPDFAPW